MKSTSCLTDFVHLIITACCLVKEQLDKVFEAAPMLLLT